MAKLYGRFNTIEERREWYRVYGEKNRLKVREWGNKSYKKKTEQARIEKAEREKGLNPLLVSKGIRPRKKALKNCKGCGVEFYPISSNNRGFCGLECYKKTVREPAKRTCIMCESVFYCTPSQLMHRNRKTCSMKCRSALSTKRAEDRIAKDPKAVKDVKRSLRYSKKMGDWRKAVFERDNYTCQTCGGRNGNGKTVYLQAHHIKQFAYHEDLRFNVDNGKTVCKACHKLENHVRILKPKTLPQLTKDLDKIFSTFIRLRFADANGMVRCFTSGKVMHYKKSQAGHFISRRHMATRWDEINVQVQSMHENIFNQGNAPVFAKRIIEVYGQKALDTLLQKKTNKSKMGKFEHELLIKEYTAKVKVLERKHKGFYEPEALGDII